MEAEFFGGMGDQGAILYRDGKVDWLSEFGAVRPSGSQTPISQALAKLGVDGADHHDEFAALGLGRHRRTKDWTA